MAMNNNAVDESEDRITLSIGGVTHDRWSAYRIDSDLLTPADAWDVTLEIPNTDPLPAAVKKGALVKLGVLRAGVEEALLSGSIDTLTQRTDKRGRTLRMDGRDLGARLIDCAAPMLQLKNATLAAVVNQAVKALNITKVEWRAKAAATSKLKVATDPGQNVWDWLRSACEANKVWPWFEPDGTLVIGQPNYRVPISATLVLDTGRTNVLMLQRTESMSDDFEQVVVYAQAGGTGGDGTAHAKATAHSSTGKAEGYTRRKVVVDGNAHTTALATARAQKIAADGKMEGDKLQVTVRGHRTAEGKLWQAGMRVSVDAPSYGIDGVWFVMGRAYTLSRQEGKQTELRLVQDGAWVLDESAGQPKKKAKAKKRKARRAAVNTDDLGGTR